jgi:hypothetical protein
LLLARLDHSATVAPIRRRELATAWLTKAADRSHPFAPILRHRQTSKLAVASGPHMDRSNAAGALN